MKILFGFAIVIILLLLWTFMVNVAGPEWYVR